jgi:8-oxo-dGTP diphosphatase
MTIETNNGVKTMQRVTTCVLKKGDHILLLQKPRRNWWVAPGGKMMQGETIREAVKREYREETGIYLKDPNLKGVFTFVIKEGNEVVNEWMMFTFFATKFAGDNKATCEEGILSWKHIDDIQLLEMAAGDHHILDYMLNGSGMIYGTFVYTPDFELLSYRCDSC